MDIYSAAQVLAIKATIDNDSDHERRRIMRWYSEKYHTPLHDVWDLPIEFVLQAYYEDTYDSMEKEELRRNLVVLTETLEQKKKRLKEEEEYVDPEVAADEEFAKLIEEEEKAKTEAGLRPGIVPEMPTIPAPQKISWKPSQEAESELPSPVYKLPTTQELFSINEEEDSLAGLPKGSDWSLLTPSKKQS